MHECVVRFSACQVPPLGPHRSTSNCSAGERPLRTTWCFMQCRGEAQKGCLTFGVQASPTAGPFHLRTCEKSDKTRSARFFPFHLTVFLSQISGTHSKGFCWETPHGVRPIGVSHSGVWVLQSNCPTPVPVARIPKEAAGPSVRHCALIRSAPATLAASPTLAVVPGWWSACTAGLRRLA